MSQSPNSKYSLAMSNWHPVLCDTLCSKMCTQLGGDILCFRTEKQNVSVTKGKPTRGSWEALGDVLQMEFPNDLEV